MKKLILLIALICAFALPAIASTDPFFMLRQEGMLLDSQFSYIKNPGGGDGVKLLGITETFRYGATDKIEVFGSLGIASLSGGGYSKSGLTDPVLGARYRAAEDINGDSLGDLTLDLTAYFSPSVFDSPNDSKPSGVAKGTTDFGIEALLGKMGAPGKDPWTLGTVVGIDFIGSGGQTTSAVDFHLGGVGKYYIDSLNSIDGNAGLYFYGNRGGSSDFSLRLAGGYTRDLGDGLDLAGLLGYATHSADGAKSEVSLSVLLRWQFR